MMFVRSVLIPVFFSRASESFLWTRVLIFAIAGCSLTILTGWAGQVSLGQFGFAAVGGSRHREAGRATTVSSGSTTCRGAWRCAIGVLVGAASGGAHRPARAAHPRALPRGDHARVRGVRVGVARRARARSSTSAVCSPRWPSPTPASSTSRRAAPTTTCASRSCSRASRWSRSCDAPASDGR